MTKIGIATMTLFMCLLTSNGFGQEPTDYSLNDQIDEPRKMLSPEERAGKKTEKIKAHLALTAEQTEKVTPLILEHERKMQTLIDEQKSLRQRVRTERETLKSGIDQILTEEQKVKRDEMIEQRKLRNETKSRQCCAHCGK